MNNINEQVAPEWPMAGELVQIRDFWIFRVTERVRRESHFGQVDFPIHGYLVGIRSAEINSGWWARRDYMWISKTPKTKSGAIIPMWYLAKAWDGVGVLLGSPASVLLTDALQAIDKIEATMIVDKAAGRAADDSKVEARRAELNKVKALLSSRHPWEVAS